VLGSPFQSALEFGQSSGYLEFAAGQYSIRAMHENSAIARVPVVSSASAAASYRTCAAFRNGSSEIGVACFADATDEFDPPFGSAAVALVNLLRTAVREASLCPCDASCCSLRAMHEDPHPPVCGLTPATSASELGSPLPHRHRDWDHLMPHLAPGRGSTPAGLLARRCHSVSRRGAEVPVQMWQTRGSPVSTPSPRLESPRLIQTDGWAAVPGCQAYCR
jgi:hypothetical protein